MRQGEYRFCPSCGSALITASRYGKDRQVCPQCDWIHFEDPKVAVAVVVQREGKVLLVQRGNEPLRACWTLPAGFVDAYEDPLDACRRECLEETGFEVQVDRLIDVLSGREHPRGADILIAYAAHITGGELSAGDDAEAAGFFDLQDLPPLAFMTTQSILEKLERA